MTIAVGFSSETFEFKSKYPKLWIAAYPVANDNLVDPDDDAHKFLDGEYAVLGATGTLDRAAILNQNDADIMQAHHVTGNPGRGDLQFGQIPFCMDDQYLFRSRLHDGNVGAGTAPVTGELCTLENATVVIEGTNYAGRTCLIALNTGADGYYVARAVDNANDAGWITFYATRGHWTA